MCRLLMVRGETELDPATYLGQFREISRQSREYQGHGWGCAWLAQNGHWQFYRNLNPVWEDETNNFPETRLFIAHARSAFRDEGICIENNMPFSDGNTVFVFNGELQGVRIREEGRIGAEKIYNYLKRFDRGDLGAAVSRGIGVIDKRTRYIRAMNIFLAESNAVHVVSWFGEEPEYFQMRQAIDHRAHIICSMPLDLASQPEWHRIPNHTVFRVSLDQPLEISQAC